jgi:hypothetical protein
LNLLMKKMHHINHSFNQSESDHSISDSLLIKSPQKTSSHNNNDSLLNSSTGTNGSFINDNTMMSKFGQNHHFKRDPAHRIFTNRNFQLSDIKFYGFDMVY